MKILFFPVLLLFLSACSGGSAGNEQLSGCDSLVVYFNTPLTDSVEKIVTTTEKKAIKKLAGFVNGKPSEAYKCGYDGNLMFYSQGSLKGDVSFNYSGDSCRHFMMMIENKLTPTTMSNEAADFLKSLAEGKEWY
ncbi:MAG: hypothetical protein H7Y01_07620 [Ferruginibacter sp.]|nr:hypothetical protein [Chitinophagaceae bacterium]